MDFTKVPDKELKEDPEVKKPVVVTPKVTTPVVKKPPQKKPPEKSFLSKVSEIEHQKRLMKIGGVRTQDGKLKNKDGDVVAKSKKIK